MFSPSALSPRARRLVSAAIHEVWDWVSEAGAITTGDARSLGFGSFGRASAIAFPHGAMFGERWIHIGEETVIGPHVTLSAGMVPDQQMYTDPVVSIGNRCAIGRGSHIVGHLSIDIGDDVHFGPYVYVTDQNHGYEALDVPIGKQWPVNEAVRIGAGSWLGVGVKVLPGALIGSHVTVAAGSVVRGMFPDRCVIAGVPARVVRRYVDGAGWINDTELDGSRP
jgi:serine acetyltransferase